jgi:hypothetical protein
MRSNSVWFAGFGERSGTAAVHCGARGRVRSGTGLGTGLSAKAAWSSSLAGTDAGTGQVGRWGRRWVRGAARSRAMMGTRVGTVIGSESVGLSGTWVGTLFWAKSGSEFESILGGCTRFVPALRTLSRTWRHVRVLASSYSVAFGRVIGARFESSWRSAGPKSGDPLMVSARRTNSALRVSNCVVRLSCEQSWVVVEGELECGANEGTLNVVAGAG